MHRKIVLLLQPMATPTEAMEAMEEDWLRDTMGEASLSKQRFVISWFELADLWTESMAAEEYEEFLTNFLARILFQHPDGVIEWKRDEHIIREHFRDRQEKGKKVTDTYNMPLCLSRWNKHLKNQAKQRAAVLAADRIQAGFEAANRAMSTTSRPARSPLYSKRAGARSPRPRGAARAARAAANHRPATNQPAAAGAARASTPHRTPSPRRATQVGPRSGAPLHRLLWIEPCGGAP